MSSPTNAKATPLSVPKINNLDRLSESSTGDWERGRTTHNARSPTQASVLETHMSGLNINKTPTAPSASQSTPTPHAAVPSSSASVGSVGSASGSTRSNLVPRLAREGYGFRPASGTSTPVMLRSPPTEAQPTDDSEVSQEADEPELDSSFNEDVKRALQQPTSLSVGANALIPEGGIADAEGLGWPGEFSY